MTLEECKAIALASGVKPHYVQEATDWGVPWEEVTKDYHGDDALAFWDGLAQAAPGRKTWILCGEMYIARAEAVGVSAEKLAGRKETLEELKSWD